MLHRQLEHPSGPNCRSDLSLILCSEVMIDFRLLSHIFYPAFWLTLLAYAFWVPHFSICPSDLLLLSSISSRDTVKDTIPSKHLPYFLMANNLHPIHRAEQHAALSCNGYCMRNDLAMHLTISAEEKSLLVMQSTSCYWY